jgi:hypothetical protein
MGWPRPSRGYACARATGRILADEPGRTSSDDVRTSRCPKRRALRSPPGEPGRREVRWMQPPALPVVRDPGPRPGVRRRMPPRRPRRRRPDGTRGRGPSTRRRSKDARDDRVRSGRAGDGASLESIRAGIGAVRSVEQIGSLVRGRGAGPRRGTRAGAPAAPRQSVDPPVAGDRDRARRDGRDRLVALAPVPSGVLTPVDRPVGGHRRGIRCRRSLVRGRPDGRDPRDRA